MMRALRAPAAFAAAVVVIGLFTVEARAQVANADSLYRLGDGSKFQTGCFPPCLCPSLPATAGPKGTFVLSFTGMTGAFRNYQVRDVNWFVDLGGVMTRITGSGTYRIGIAAIATVHQMELDLVVGSNAAAHFDSGLVAASGPPFPAINIRVSIHGGMCQDTVIDIGTAPVPAAQMRPYHLENSSYAQGCFPPCCLEPPSSPAAGGMILVPLPDYANTQPRGNQDFALVHAAWFVGGSITPATQSWTGSGIFRRRFGPIVTPSNASVQRLVMDLRPSTTIAPVRFDSGWTLVPFNTPPSPSVALPYIDAVISASGFTCEDKRFTVHARPNTP